ncbi:5-hydroxytryptamine receptor 4 isoform X1 [Thunnus thynnus]|uniref:5-hydroxytryptamine receptor 4 isoform X1 n=1 Tax=Thunnus thynnus TaxID=8237 RepID=UPI0035274B38
MPFAAIELTTGQWRYGEIFCLVRTSLDVLLTTASILHLCCIALDRYYAICCQPLVYRHKMTPARVAVMLSGCWLIPTFISFLPIMQSWNAIGIEDIIEERRALTGGSNDTSCVFLVNRPYALICSAVAFYVPLALMVLAYQRIYVTAMTHVRQIETLQRAGSAPMTGTAPIMTVRSSTSSDPSEHYRFRTTMGSSSSEKAPMTNSRLRVETKAAKTLAVIMGCFCLCWAPFFITNVVDPFIHYSVPWQLWTAWLWLGYINSGLNPFLYAFLNRAFRRAFLVILCCGDERYVRQGSYSYGHTHRVCSAASVNGTSMALRKQTQIIRLPPAGYWKLTAEMTGGEILSNNFVSEVWALRNNLWVDGYDVCGCFSFRLQKSVFIFSLSLCVLYVFLCAHAKKTVGMLDSEQKRGQFVLSRITIVFF